MKHLEIWIFIVVVFTTCIHRDDKGEILTAKFTNKGITTTDCLFRMYADSTYTLDVHEFQEYRHEKNEIFRGRYYLKGDSIVFFPMRFGFAGSEFAMVKTGYIEFLEGKMPFKMKVTTQRNRDYKGIDTITYKDYGFFSYDTTFYHFFPKEVIAYDLTDLDLVKVETILKSCLKEADVSFELKDYFKQCIAVRNKNNEREVWVNLLCHPKDIDELKYFVVETHDGGDCYLNVKVNLDKEEYYDLTVNGGA